MIDRLMVRIQTATNATDRLRSARKTIEQVHGQLEGHTDSTATKARKKGKVMADSLDALLHQIVPKEYKGIRGDSTLVDARLAKVGFISGRNTQAPTVTERFALERAEQRLRVTLNRVNGYIAEQWPVYKQVVEKANPNILEEYEPLFVDGSSSSVQRLL